MVCNECVLTRNLSELVYIKLCSLKLFSLGSHCLIKVNYKATDSFPKMDMPLDHLLLHLQKYCQSFQKSTSVCLVAFWSFSPHFLVLFCEFHNHTILPLQVSPCLNVLSWLLFVSDTDVLADACWALSYLSDGPNDKIQAVIDAGVCRRLVELLM